MKKTTVCLFVFFLFGCKETLEDRVTDDCMNEMNKYSVATLEQCQCFYDEARKKLSPEQMEGMLSKSDDPQIPLLNNGGMNFITVLSSSACF